MEVFRSIWPFPDVISHVTFENFDKWHIVLNQLQWPLLAIQTLKTEVMHLVRWLACFPSLLAFWILFLPNLKNDDVRQFFPRGMKKDKVSLVDVKHQFITVKPCFNFTKFSVDGIGEAYEIISFKINAGYRRIFLRNARRR